MNGDTVSEKSEALVRANLLDVFAERDGEKRLAAITTIYADDVVFADPEGTVTGWDALNAKAQGLLDGAPGFVFTPTSPVLLNQDAGYLAWAFGPEGADPVARGVDVSFIENGRIVKLYTFL